MNGPLPYCSYASFPLLSSTQKKLSLLPVSIALHSRLRNSPNHCTTLQSPCMSTCQCEGCHTCAPSPGRVLCTFPFGVVRPLCEPDSTERPESRPYEGGRGASLTGGSCSLQDNRRDKDRVLWAQTNHQNKILNSCRVRYSHKCWSRQAAGIETSSCRNSMKLYLDSIAMTVSSMRAESTAGAICTS